MVLQLTKLSWKGLRRQLWLLGALAVYFLALTLGIGPVARAVLSQGVGFSGITLAVAAPEGDSTGQLVEQLTKNMRDIREFATLVNMEEEEALQALESGEVTAVLLLPENFLSGVLGGSNPDVTLVVDPDRPLEALLTYWVGVSAADLLTSAQRGIYTVLDLYPGQTGQSWEQTKNQINLDFITLTLNRQGIFRQEVLEPTGAIPLEGHYALSLLLFLVMALPTLLSAAFGGGQLPLRRRLAVLGYRAAAQYGSSLLVCCPAVLALILAPGLLITGGNMTGCLLCGIFGALWAGLCWGITRSSAGCGWISLGLGAVLVFFSGGVLPPALLPDWVNAVSAFLPIAPLREMMYLNMEDWTLRGSLTLLIWLLLMLAAGALLYRSRLAGKEETV